jgi:hypothetical protein
VRYACQAPGSRWRFLRRVDANAAFEGPETLSFWDDAADLSEWFDALR